ncbi:MAG: amino acid permease [Alphaproteobacteria bacterium]|nr:MAG: amino acid permease [Alphaproteobacteria bacterium]
MSENNRKNDNLKRSISLPLLILYGLGTMIGGGIYALTGKVIGVAGMYAPIAFALSAFLALITAFSYAEMAARFPLSAGEVRYVNAAFSRKNFATLIGWLVIFMAVVSAAALASATAGFIQDFINLPEGPLTAVIVLTLGLVAAWGITQSVALVTIITLIEIGGLLLIVFTGRHDLATLDTRWTELIPQQAELHDFVLWSSILSGAFLAFYAFIGFEDMVNVAEEVKDVQRAMPRAIIICIVLTLIMYVLVALVAVLSVPLADLAQSNTPMAVIMDHNGEGIPPYLMGLISILATVNGALVQIIMGARVLYGMGKGGEAPVLFGRVHHKTQTPLQATSFVIVAALILALLFDLGVLARVTSTIILFVFAVVNAALLKIKWTEDVPPQGLFSIHWSIPLTGFAVCSTMLAFEIGRLFIN